MRTEYIEKGNNGTFVGNSKYYEGGYSLILLDKKPDYFYLEKLRKYFLIVFDSILLLFFIFNYNYKFVDCFSYNNKYNYNYKY